MSILLFAGVEIAYSGPSANAARPSANRPFNFPTKRRSTVISQGLKDKKQMEAQRATYKKNVISWKHQTLDFFKRKENAPKMKSDAIGQVMQGIQLVVKKDTMPVKKREQLVDTLLNYSTIKMTPKEYQASKDTLRNRLVDVTKKHPGVAKSLQQMREKVESRQLKLNPGDYENVLFFVASLGEINPLANSAKNVTAESALLSLGAHVGDMLSWQPASTRDSVMNLFKTYIQERTDSSGPAAAFRETLIRRGYTTLAEQMDRSRDIIENCRI